MAVPTPAARVTAVAESATGFIDDIFHHVQQVIDQLGGEAWGPGATQRRRIGDQPSSRRAVEPSNGAGEPPHPSSPVPD
jgi:hypothetical protein